MKAVRTDTTATSAKKNIPFFNKESEGNFFHSSGKEQPFFSSQKNSFFKAQNTIQTKLTVGEPDDMYEKEADAMADKVVQRLSENKSEIIQNKNAIQRKHIVNASTITPFIQTKCAEREKEEKLQKKPILGSNKIQRKCAECEKEDKKKIQKKSNNASSENLYSNIESSLNASKGSGKQLTIATREQMENSFGANFSNVKIHTDSSAVQMNNDLNAQAFTHGSDIYFNSGKYDTNSKAGKHLLAHELTHVVQQGRENIVRRNLIDDLRAEAEARATAQLTNLANKPVVTHSGFTGHAGCHPNFCQPFASVPEAIADLVWAGPLILAGIATKVNPRVVPLWATYLRGGSSPQNLSADFGSDFTASPTTAITTRFLIGEMRRDIEANRTTIMGGLSSAFIDFNPRIASAVAAIDDPANSHKMNFDVIGDIAGNIAGGIGKDETLFPIGATPSPFNDAREVSITALLTLNANGSITVTPFINFTVKDTIDLCPGDCGAPREQVATVPLSRFEATGLSGDVPMIIQFPAPAAELTPFVIPAPPPIAGTVSASALNIRVSPDISSAIVGRYNRNESIIIICQTTGSSVDGNNVWYKTDRGFVSALYVTKSVATIPSSC